jgi:protoporphyrinogen/coproporphyrinogen III oxidase
MSAAPSAPRRVIVIGGGVSGLAAAHRLHELALERGQPLDLLLLEAGLRLGGLVSTTLWDGFVLEGGPDSFITDKPWALALSRRLGLEAELVGTNAAMRRSFILRGNRLMPVPEGFHLMAPSRLWPFFLSPLMSWPGRLRLLAEWLVPPSPVDGDESLASFVERRLGQEALERVAQPMIAGIYGSDPASLSLRATMPRFLDMERAHGGVIRGLLARQRRGSASGVAGWLNGLLSPAPVAATAGVSGARYGLFVSFRHGMQTLTDTLAARLPAGSMRLNSRALGVSQGPAGGWRVAVGPHEGAGSEETLDADAVCLALPAFQAATLLRDLDRMLAGQLDAIDYSPSATMNLGYRREDIRHPLNGFGFVVPRIEKRPILGCTFSSVKFPNRAPEGHALLRAFIGGPDPCDRDPAELAATVRAELEGLLGITAPPMFTELWRESRAMPQYEVGHLDRVAEIEASVDRHSGLALAGSAYRGIGIPDCVHSGEQAAERLMGRA